MTNPSSALSRSAALKFSLSRNAWGKLLLTDAAGNSHSDVIPIRAFPISDPRHWISICNSAGRELVCIENLDHLPSETREAIVSELASREFLPVLQRVISISGFTEPSHWDVLTDRGRTQFIVKGEEDFRRLGPESAILTDASGVRYRIENLSGLDRKSRQIIERYV
jgi:hypothetical protein